MWVLNKLSLLLALPPTALAHYPEELVVRTYVTSVIMSTELQWGAWSCLISDTKYQCRWPRACDNCSVWHMPHQSMMRLLPQIVTSLHFNWAVVTSQLNWSDFRCLVTHVTDRESVLTEISHLLLIFLPQPPPQPVLNSDKRWVWHLVSLTVITSCIYNVPSWGKCIYD